MNELPHPLGPGDKLTGTWISNLLRAVRRMKPLQGPGISTRVTPDGTVISAAVAAPRAAAPLTPLTPFAVRLHKTENDTDGQWEIYLPPGCCNVGGPCDPLNPPASDTTGHEDDDDGWYAFKVPLNTSYFTTDDSVGSSHERGPTTYKNSFVVTAHVKPSAMLAGVDPGDAPARRLLWIGVRDQNRSNSGSSGAYPDSVRYKDTPGDTWACDVAVIFGSFEIDWSQHGASAANAEKKWRVNQCRTTPVDVALPSGTGISEFDLVWNLAVSDDGELDVANILCVRQAASAAGIAITGDTMTDVLGATEVYARVNTTDISDGSGIVQVLKDPQGINLSTPYIVWLHLYSLKHNTVTADHRSQSLVNIQLFHA